MLALTRARRPRSTRLTSAGILALHLAVENGHCQVAKELIDRGADVKIARKNHWDCLMSACYYGATEILQLLVDKKANVNAIFKDGHTDKAHWPGSYAPIHLACYNGFDATVSELCRLGVNVNQTTGHGWSPLMIAAAQGHTKTVSCLIATKATVNYKNSDDGGHDGMTAVMAAVSAKEGINCLGLLLQARADVHMRDAWGSDAPMLAARAGQTQSAKQLLLQGADPRAIRMGKSTALMDAAAAGSDAIVKLLLAAGADPHAWDADHRDALMHAAKRGHELCVLPLIHAGANVQKAIGQASTKQAARRLIEAGATCEKLSESICVELGCQRQRRATRS